MIRKTAKTVLRHFSRNNYLTLNRIELDRGRVLANVAYMRKICPNQEVIPVLKANAYGHGLAEMAKILNDTDCAFVATDGYFEASLIRDITRHRILVMGYIKPENAHLLDTRRCSFVVQDAAGMHALGALNKTVRIHLEVNTGMFRQGLQPCEIDEYLETIKKYPKIQLEGVMTHLADADNEATQAFTAEQSRLFDEAISRILRKGFKPEYFHIAQTAGSAKAESRYANSIRLGIGIYGINPLSSKDEHFDDLAGLQPVLQLKSTIVKTYDLKKGDKVSYNGIFTATGDMRVGTLPLGYYEGVPRELSNKGYVMFDSRQAPIVGKVCMNHTIIDITGTYLKVGDEVTVIGNDSAEPNSVQYASAAHGIFSYVWLANISSSVRRIIV